MEAHIGRTVQLSAPGRMLELFDIDFTPINQDAGVQYFYPSRKEDGGLGVITWRGNPYVPLPIQITGIAVTGKGALPRPQITASNVLNSMTTLYQALGGKVGGAVLTRWVTFEQYLDGNAQANTDAHLTIDQWYLDKVVKHNRLNMVLECRSILDFSRQRLPRRQMLRGHCGHTYRVWDPDLGNFNYSKASCPWGSDPGTGTPYLDESDQPCAPQQDKCSKNLIGGCRGRFGTKPLPFRGFPGMNRYG